MVSNGYGRLKDKVRTASFLAPGHAGSLLFVICPYLKRTEKEGDFMHIKRGEPPGEFLGSAGEVEGDAGTLT